MQVLVVVVVVVMMITIMMMMMPITIMTRFYHRQWMFTSFVVCSGSCGQQKQLFYCPAHFDKACCSCTMDSRVLVHRMPLSLLFQVHVIVAGDHDARVLPTCGGDDLFVNIKEMPKGEGGRVCCVGLVVRVCVCVCMCVYVCACVCPCVYVLIFVCLSVCVTLSASVYVCVWLFVLPHLVMYMRRAG